MVARCTPVAREPRRNEKRFFPKARDGASVRRHLVAPPPAGPRAQSGPLQEGKSGETCLQGWVEPTPVQAFPKTWSLTEVVSSSPSRFSETGIFFPRYPWVSLPALREGGFGLVFATVFSDPGRHQDRPYEEALRQINYLGWEKEGLVRILRFGKSLKDYLLRYPKDGVLCPILILEGAHALPEPEALDELHVLGVRMVSLT